MIPRRPIAYLRRSSASTSNGAGRVSFDVQRTSVLELARRYGDELAESDLIVEWGLSGAAAESKFGGTGRGGKRHAYLDLRAAIAEGRVGALYAYSLSRLARSTRDLLALAELCVDAGVPIRLAKEGEIDGTTASGRLYLTVLAAVSAFEAETSAERSRDRNASMRERGAHIGRPPYGYVIGPDGTLVPDPHEKPIVDRVIALYQELGSPARVARALNREGVAAPRGGTWGDGTVRRILARAPGAVLRPTVQGSRAVPTAIFQRLVRCGVCGGTMTPDRKLVRLASGQDKTFVAYVCSRARFDPSHGRGNRVTETALLAFAQAEAARLRLPEAVEQAANPTPRLELEARRERVVDTFVAGLIDKQSRDKRLAAIDAQVDALDAAAQAVVEIPKLDWTWPPEAVNRVLHAIWERIDLDREGRPTGVIWRLPEEYVAP